MKKFRTALLAILMPVLTAATPPAKAPSLRIDAATYDLGNGVLHIAFTFANPSDSVLYLDCQVPPRASLSGGTLTLTFARNASEAEGVLAGGPAPSDSAPAVSAPAASASAPSAAPSGTAPSAPSAASSPASPVDMDAYLPQRIAGGQTFQGQRRLDRISGSASARPKFTSLRVVMGYYPERSEGEGPSFVAERGMRVAAAPHAVARKGRPPAPPKPVRIFKTEP